MKLLAHTKCPANISTRKKAGYRPASEPTKVALFEQSNVSLTPKHETVFRQFFP